MNTLKLKTRQITTSNNNYYANHSTLKYNETLKIKSLKKLEKMNINQKVIL